MKKLKKRLLNSAIAASLAVAGAASAQPLVGAIVSVPGVGDVLGIGIAGDSGLVDVNLAGSRFAISPDSNPLTGAPRLVGDLQRGTGIPVADLISMVPSLDDGPLPGLPGDPAEILDDLLPTGANPIPTLPVDPVGTLVGLISSGGGGVPSLPGLPVDPVGTVTGLIPAGGGLPSLPALPVDLVGTVTSVLSADVPTLPIP